MSESSRVPVVPLVVAVVAAVALVATLVWGPGDESDGPAAAVVPGSSGTSGNVAMAGLARREAGDPMAMGEVDAPVVMVEYSEFQCPFCGRFARDTAPTLIRDYVEKGILRIEFRDFPYLGKESEVAARGARAAAGQDRFWEFHDLMFGNQLPPNSGRLDREHLAGIAGQAGLDTERFLADLDSPEIRQGVERDRQEGLGLGVTGTPAFFINGGLVMGAQPTEVFVRVIEAAAEEARE